MPPIKSLRNPVTRAHVFERAEYELFEANTKSASAVLRMYVRQHLRELKLLR